MKATFVTLLLALAPALPIISGLPSEKRLVDPNDRDHFPVTTSCSGLSISDDGILFAENCEGNPFIFNLDTCVGNNFGELVFEDSGFSEECTNCTIVSDAQLNCNCFGGDFNSTGLNLQDCQFLRWDGIKKTMDCSSIGRPCPNPA
ncbi:hypothetical protein F4821DRAFT_256582 [Hypoxylon rubiginosum]|uniref:Uncharacterized protein n=1 Tax=Hypoxylon rubiginosum TaxID=110542 RepID=A0ACC0DB86_9PEZI|nr:hypothetical protein F4821DRAFT_256582 [Hypoxylon rubiginosum]